jgi:transcriptional antiterminator NusG
MSPKKNNETEESNANEMSAEDTNKEKLPVESPAEEPAEDATPDADASVKMDATSDADASAKTDAPEEAPAEAEAKPAPEEQPEAADSVKEAAAAGADEGADEPSGPPLKWYVVHTYSGHENKVRENILKMIKTSVIGDQFGRLIVPTEEVAEMRKGKKTITTQKFFPSYILIEMHMTNDSWHLVNSIPGVTSFVGAGRKPQPLSKQEVERILGRMDKEKQTIAPEIPFTVGEHIRIKDGPFSDFTGVIDEISVERGKLKVLVSIFGRETPVELDFLQVESI